MATRELTRDHARTHRPKPPVFWFRLAIVVILLFGCLLAVILWLSNAGGHTSNDPNRQPHNSSVQRYEQPAGSFLT